MRFKQQYLEEAGVSLKVYPVLQEFVSNGIQDGRNRESLWNLFSKQKILSVFFISICVSKHTSIYFDLTKQKVFMPFKLF